MDAKKFKSILDIGEHIAIEFKSCKAGAKDDTYETICSFLNRFGGDIFFGVEDNGEITGVPHNAVAGTIKNIVKMIGNPEVISPTVYLTPSPFIYEGKDIIHIHIPPSSEVHSFKKIIYDRIDDADVKIAATGAIAAMYIRKQKIFTEKRVFPHIKDEDLRFDLFPKIRKMAVIRNENHPWKHMDEKEIIRSAGLYAQDMETEKWGYNLAAVMLLGRDEVIKDICPTHRTDALLRKVNTDRYDDRLIVETNLIESYDLLMGFAEKHLWDKFYLENDARVSLRGKIAREMLVNTLMHREFSSTYFAKFVIEKDRMFVENANRAARTGVLTPDNFEPDSKNPIIAAFLRNIGYADELGSGVRNLFRYVKLYSGKEPQFIEGDIFKIIVPLDDNYSFDKELFKVQSGDSSKCNDCTLSCTLDESNILEFVKKNPKATQNEVASYIGKSLRSVKDIMLGLQAKGLLERKNGKRDGYWEVKES